MNVTYTHQTIKNHQLYNERNSQAREVGKIYRHLIQNYAFLFILLFSKVTQINATNTIRRQPETPNNVLKPSITFIEINGEPSNTETEQNAPKTIHDAINENNIDVIKNTLLQNPHKLEEASPIFETNAITAAVYFDKLDVLSMILDHDPKLLLASDEVNYSVFVNVELREDVLLNPEKFFDSKNNALIESLIKHFPQETKQIFEFFDYMMDEIKTNDQFSVRESKMLNQVNDWLTSIASEDNLEIFKFIFENYPTLVTKNLPICKNPQSLLDCDQSESEKILIKSAEYGSEKILNFIIENKTDLLLLEGVDQHNLIIILIHKNHSELVNKAIDRAPYYFKTLDSNGYLPIVELSRRGKLNEIIKLTKIIPNALLIRDGYGSNALSAAISWNQQNELIPYVGQFFPGYLTIENILPLSRFSHASQIFNFLNLIDKLESNTSSFFFEHNYNEIMTLIFRDNNEFYFDLKIIKKLITMDFNKFMGILSKISVERGQVKYKREELAYEPENNPTYNKNVPFDSFFFLTRDTHKVARKEKGALNYRNPRVIMAMMVSESPFTIQELFIFNVIASNDKSILNLDSYTQFKPIIDELAPKIWYSTLTLLIHFGFDEIIYDEIKNNNIDALSDHNKRGQNSALFALKNGKYNFIEYMIDNAPSLFKKIGSDTLFELSHQSVSELKNNQSTEQLKLYKKAIKSFAATTFWESTPTAKKMFFYDEFMYELLIQNWHKISASMAGFIIIIAINIANKKYQLNKEKLANEIKFNRISNEEIGLNSENETRKLIFLFLKSSAITNSSNETTLGDEKKEKLRKFYTIALKKFEKDDLFTKCAVSLEEWHYIPDPVICESLYFSKQILETLKQYKGLHPVLNTNANIEFYDDPIFKEFQALRKEAFENATECIEKIIDNITITSKKLSDEINLGQNLALSQ